MKEKKITGHPAFALYSLAVGRNTELLLVQTQVSHNNSLGVACMTAVTVYWDQEGEKSMAAVFRVTRNVLLRRNNNVDSAFGKVFDFCRIGSLLLLDRVQKTILADHFVRWSVS